MIFFSYVSTLVLYEMCLGFFCTYVCFFLLFENQNFKLKATLGIIQLTSPY